MITSTETASVKATQRYSNKTTFFPFFSNVRSQNLLFSFFFHYFSFLLKKILHSCEYVQEKRFAKARPEIFAF